MIIAQHRIGTFVPIVKNTYSVINIVTVISIGCILLFLKYMIVNGSNKLKIELIEFAELNHPVEPVY